MAELRSAPLGRERGTGVLAKLCPLRARSASILPAAQCPGPLYLRGCFIGGAPPSRQPLAKLSSSSSSSSSHPLPPLSPTHPCQILFEEEQILPDGRSRRRNVALSEKLIGDEDWQDAVLRAVQEELGSILPSGYEVGEGG